MRACTLGFLFDIAVHTGVYTGTGLTSMFRDFLSVSMYKCVSRCGFFFYVLKSFNTFFF